MEKAQLELVEPKTNLPKVLGEIEKIKTEVGDLAIRMSANQVETQEEYDRAVALGKQANEAIKKFEKKRDEVLSPAKSFVEKVRDVVKAIVTPIETAQSNLRDRCAGYIRKERERQAKELAKLQAKKNALEEKAISSDTVVTQNNLLNKAAKVEAKIETVAAAKPKNSTRQRKFEIVDPNLIPREYLIPDEKAIRKAAGPVDSPLPSIPGIRFYDDEKVSFG